MLRPMDLILGEARTEQLSFQLKALFGRCGDLLILLRITVHCAAHMAGPKVQLPRQILNLPQRMANSSTYTMTSKPYILQQLSIVHDLLSPFPFILRLTCETCIFPCAPFGR